MIEDDFLPDLSLVEPGRGDARGLARPRPRRRVELADGRRITAVQLQWEYLEHATKYVDREDDTPAQPRGRSTRWEAVLDGLESRPDVACSASSTGSRSYRVLEGYRERDGLEWADPKLRAIDLQYHDVRRGKGLYDRLAAAGKVERLVDRRGGRARRDGAARGHPRVLPRPLHLALPGRDRRGVVGLPDLRHRARDACSGCRCASRSRARRPTSRSCWRPRRPPPTWSIASRPDAPSSPGRSGTGGRMTARKGATVPEQEQKRIQKKGGADDDGRRRRRPGQRVPKAAELKDEMDEILDEIDSVLEENAEEFVKSYVQKGGRVSDRAPAVRSAARRSARARASSTCSGASVPRRWRPSRRGRRRPPFPRAARHHGPRAEVRRRHRDGGRPARHRRAT